MLSAKTKDDVKSRYVEIIRAELLIYHCNDLELAYKRIYGDINVDGLWYRVTRLKK